jgi:excisionase family DNA binding protein
VSKTLFRLSNRLALSVKEAAEVVGVSERHMRDLLPSIPHFRAGTKVVIPTEPLREWLRDQAVIEKLRTDQLADEILESITKD